MENKEANPQLEKFGRRYEEELDGLLDSGICDDEPLPPDPSSMGMGETSLEELTDDELSVVRETLFKKLEVNPLDPKATHRTYQTEAPQEASVPGEINVRVFKTNREEAYLQEMTFQDGKRRWTIGPDSNM